MDLLPLIDAGFTHDEDMRASLETSAERQGMHNNGPYVVHGVLRRDAVVLKVEQNTATEGNLTITYPPVCVVSGPRGTVTCEATDTELILTLAHDLG